jgi:hypothetical protein
MKARPGKAACCCQDVVRRKKENREKKKGREKRKKRKRNLRKFPTLIFLGDKNKRQFKELVKNIFF